MRNPPSAICMFKRFVPPWLAEWLTLESFAHPIRTLHGALSSLFSTIIRAQVNIIHMHARALGSFTEVLCWLVSGENQVFARCLQLKHSPLSLHTVDSSDFSGRTAFLKTKNKSGQVTPLKMYCFYPQYGIRDF